MPVAETDAGRLDLDTNFPGFRPLLLQIEQFASSDYAKDNYPLLKGSEARFFLGTVWIGAGATVELQFSETAAPAVPGQPDAWEPQEKPEEPTP